MELLQLQDGPQLELKILLLKIKETKQDYEGRDFWVRKLVELVEAGDTDAAIRRAKAIIESQASYNTRSAELINLAKSL